MFEMMALEQRVLHLDSFQGLHERRDAGLSLGGKDTVLYETTGASSLLRRIRRRNHPASRSPIKSTGLEIELTKRTVSS